MDNPEREWTIEEQEEFFASVDAITGIPNGCLIGGWASNGPLSWNIEDLLRTIYPGIHVTSITPPEQGWPIVAHCDLCHKTEIVLSPWAVKPSDGDYFKMNGTCLDEENHLKHNMYPQTWYPWRDYTK